MSRWWKQRTLRFRLALWYGIGGTLLLAAFSAIVYGFVEYRIARPLDHGLQQDLLTVKKHLAVGADGRVRWRGQEAPQGTALPVSEPWFELWNSRGELVRRYWPFVDSRLDRLPVAPAAGRETISVFSVSPDVRLRVLSVPLHVESRGEDWMVRVMTIHEPAVNALGALLAIIVVALPVTVLLLVVGGYAITRRWLKPLAQMVNEADLITASDLNRRLSVANPHDELGRLAVVFNMTLARLQDSFVALDRFVADASHELLTPLTTLRSVGEVGLRSVRSPEEYREIIGSMLEETQRLQLLVEKLLQLARAEGGAEVVELSPVRIDQVASDAVEDARILAEEKHQRISLRASECTAQTDRLFLRQALQNILDNAIKYSPANSEIGVTVSESEDMISIAVTDHGQGVSTAARERLTDRFFCAEPSRDRRRGGYGLGLAITKAYMRVLGGALEYRPGFPSGSRFELRLPVRRSAAGALSPL